MLRKVVPKLDPSPAVQDNTFCESEIEHPAFQQIRVGESEAGDGTGYDSVTTESTRIEAVEGDGAGCVLAEVDRNGGL